ncbi:MAG: DUF447 family protein [Planctomycetales bacterium]|nr:DUF447 family protein [Planctomycetales bacterium]
MPSPPSQPEHPDELIAEGIVTTVNPDGSPNISPMGPRVDRDFTHLLLRPFQTSTTYVNLKRTGEGVFHITDDVLLIAKAAVGQLIPEPPLHPATQIRGFLLADACRWFVFRVSHLDDSQERTTIDCTVVGSGNLRPFFGFNRAKHAVLEAAILATRIGILPAEQIVSELEQLAIPVEKTAGQQEREAFKFLRDHVTKTLSGLKS